jgi:hypothetical protein
MDERETEPETKTEPQPEPQALTEEQLAAVTGGWREGNKTWGDDWLDSK